MEHQRLIRLKLPPNPRKAKLWNIADQQIFTERLKNAGKYVPPTPKSKLVAKLKSISNRIIGDMTACQPLQIPVQIARLDEFVVIVELIQTTGLIPPEEWEITDSGLGHPASLADWMAALQMTRQNHRGPAFVNPHAEMIQRVERKLDFIAAALARSPELMETLSGINAEEEI